MNGADLNASEDDGCTPLCEAALLNHVEIAKLLLELGADPAKSWKGETPLQIANRKGFSELEETLKSRLTNARPNSR